ncbi:MAG: radical SAM protein, partial [Candidatus Binatales bacterium]
MNFELDAVFIEEDCRASALADRVVRGLPRSVPLSYVADGRELARPQSSIADPFGAGKRRMVVMRRRSPFMMACPAASSEFACCGYLVLALASNCPMDCSYCFLQEYVADNPSFQVYANYAEAFEELERMTHKAPGRNFRVGTGELADSLAFDRLTGISRDLVEYFARSDALLLELKTKTDEIDNLLAVDPKGHTLVSWTLSPEAVFASSEHRTAPPTERIRSAKRVADAGYRVAFHLDPIIAYPDAERDYLQLLDALFDNLAPERISFISLGGLRMPPALRAAARRRFPGDPMLAGEDVLSPDGRYRTFAPLRLRIYRALSERIRTAAPRLPHYLCMERPKVSAAVLGAPAPNPAALG